MPAALEVCVYFLRATAVTKVARYVLDICESTPLVGRADHGIFTGYVSVSGITPGTGLY